MKTSFDRYRTVALTLLAAGAISAGQARAAVTYSYDVTTPVDVPGIASFATTGALMSGLSVTATFNASGGVFSETRSWAAGGANAGGVSGTGWSLGLTGNSYDASWHFSFTGSPSSLFLTRLVLDGAPGLTVFDLWLDGDTGTPNSAAGRDFSLPGSYDVTATYSKPVGVGGADPYMGSEFPYHDLWQVLTIDFGNGIGQNFSFRQDTDSVFVIPEPGTWALLGVSLLGLSILRRRRS